MCEDAPMKAFAPLGLLLCLGSVAFAQGHQGAAGDLLKDVSFMKGTWKGQQNFVTGGAPMVGEVALSIKEAIGGRYLEESSATTLPGRPASDTRHLLTFDKKSGKYKAWWFNDSANGPMELEGSVSGTKLVLESKPVLTGNGQMSTFRATYRSVDADHLEFKLELKSGEEWQSLFTSTFSRK